MIRWEEIIQVFGSFHVSVLWALSCLSAKYAIGLFFQVWGILAVAAELDSLIITPKGPTLCAELGIWSYSSSQFYSFFYPESGFIYWNWKEISRFEFIIYFIFMFSCSDSLYISPRFIII